MARNDCNTAGLMRRDGRMPVGTLHVPGFNRSYY